jgi:GPH family glycoside/pentoside/hexuronide:cation symporter
MSASSRETGVEASTGANDDASMTLSRTQMFGWAVGSHGTSVMVGAITFYLLFYMTDSLGISVLVASQIIFFVRMYDLVTDLAMGHISDRTQSRIGRRRPYLLLGAISCFITFVLLFNLPAFTSELTTILVIAFVLILYSTAYTIFNVPHLAMPAEMTSGYHERTVLMSYRVVFFISAQLLLAVGGAQLLKQFGDAQGYSLFGWIIGSTVLIAMLLSFWMTRSVVFVRRTENIHYSVRDQINLILGNRPFAIFIAAKLCLLTANASFSAAFLFFAEHVVGRGPDLMMSLGIFLTLGTLASIPVWATIAKKLGKRKALMISCVSYAAIMLTWLLSSSTEPALILNGRILLIGLCLGGIMIIGFSLLPDTIEYDRVTSGINREGIYTGMYSTVEKAASAFGPLLFGSILAAVGFISSTAGERVVQPDAAVGVIYFAVGILPAIAAIAAAGIMMFYPLDEQQLRELSRQQPARPGD